VDISEKKKKFRNKTSNKTTTVSFLALLTSVFVNDSAIRCYINIVQEAESFVKYGTNKQFSGGSG
jgi:hypothetical protein